MRLHIGCRFLQLHTFGKIENPEFQGMKNQIFFALVLLFILKPNAYAQQTEVVYDKVYLPDSTAINVFIKEYDKVKNAKCVVFYKKDGAIDSLTPAQSAGYSIGKDEHFVSKKIRVEDSTFYAFVEKIRYRGRFFYTYYNEDEKYLLTSEMEQSELLLFSKNKYKEQLSAYYQVPQEKAQFLANTRFNINSLSAAIQRFQEKEYSRFHIPFISIEAGLQSNQTYWTSPQYGAKQFENTYSYVVGAQFVIPINYRSVAINTGLSFSQNKLLTALQFNDTVQYSLSYSEIRIPLLLRYTFSSNKFRPYISAGVSYQAKVNASFQEFRFVPLDSSYTVNLEEKGIISTSSWSLNSIFGVSYLLKNNRQVYFESRYLYQLGDAAIKQNAFQMVFGISF